MSNSFYMMNLLTKFEKDVNLCLVKKVLTQLLCIFILGKSCFSFAQSIQPPEFQIIDPLGINMASGSPTFKVEDLNIGAGKLVLPHSISSYGGYFYGYVDLYQVGHNSKQMKLNSTDYGDTNLREVHFPGGSKLFIAHDDGTFEDFKKEGDTLTKVNGTDYIFTRSNGMEIHYKAGLNAEVIYPNGFTIYINRPGWRFVSITTNNGLQLEYNYSTDTLVQGDDEDQNAKNIWAYSYPTSIQAINNAFEYCDPDSISSCNATGWPEANYRWDEEMPVFIYQNFTDKDILTVKDMTGYSTTFRHSAFDTAPCLPNEEPPCTQHPDAGQYFTPRVTSKLEEGKVVQSYHYKNRESCRSTGGWGPVSCSVDIPAMLETVTAYSPVGSTTYNYDLGRLGGGYGAYAIVNNSIGLPGGVKVDNYKYTGAPMLVGQNGIVHYFQTNLTNRLMRRENGKYKTYYQFDDRKNLEEVREVGADGTEEVGQELITTADYDATCDEPKTCNKPNWIKDPMGNKTYYQYHEYSGELLVVTKPADENGIRPQTRYKYEQFYAWYHRDNDQTPNIADTPIWLVTEERSCISDNGKALKENASVDANTGNLIEAQQGCSKENDEIIISYDYGPTDGTVTNNLFLRGKTITTPDGARTTCYEYDKVGNVIGETEPKGSIAGCN